MKHKMVMGYSHNSRARLPKGSSPQGSKGYGRVPCTEAVGYSDRSLASVNPSSEQFAPSESSPIRSRQRMGGMS